ncbi:cell division protein SepF [Pseudoramibacter sp. HA2172]|uniref:cell division protein SepF n=1 Tax=Pseudoramibacter faecis TaxID=3108534 RepID=UPI002E77D3AA|nr:cell division protein SepF [Pseudoramibacter sp. HA2172]
MANEKFKDKIVKVFGMDDENYEDDYRDAYEDELDGVEDEYVEETEPVRKSSPRKIAPLTGSAEVLVLSPEFFDDAPSIVNKIKQNKTVVVNLKNTEYEDGRKIFDFLNGAVFALEGTINKIADNVFILAPKQVSVSTEMEKNSDSDFISTPILDFDADK